MLQARRRALGQQVLPAFLRRADGLPGSSAPSAGPRPRFNSPTNPSIPLGQTLKKPALANPMLPEENVPKMPIYNIGKDWVVIYTKDGRPYYYNHTTEETTWAHPRTGIVTPPSKPPEEMTAPQPILVYGARAIFGSVALFMSIAILGGSPLLGRLAGQGGGSSSAAVVQVSRRE
eukprot:TRINITY_DN48618_c0_g1_i1.p1 TRINITY_DN48618_c0_g1~~TRINITY_DN48618_c0_g1_i1.p1  ORF type:complete len:175 (-),score=27.48 TRINITY_DN48618_c0_g1_i1:59-583(-)